MSSWSKYKKKEISKKKEVKSTTAKDMKQDFRLKKVEKKVKELTTATKGWSKFEVNDVGIPTINLVPSNTIINDSTLASGLGSITVNPLANATVGAKNFLSAKHMGFEYTLHASAGNETELQNIRVLAFAIRHPTAAEDLSGNQVFVAPSYQDILQLTQPDGDTVNMDASDLLSPLTRVARGNLVMMYDKTHTLGNYGVGNDKVTLGPFRAKISVPTAAQEVDLRDDNQTVAVSNVAENMIWICAFCDARTVNFLPTLRLNGIVDFLSA